jgi:anti-sigma-K factor RskA
MSDSLGSPRDRLDALLADRAAFGLTPDEQAELAALLAAHPDVDPEALDRLAADVALSGLPAECEPLPEGLRERILRHAPAHLPVAPVPASARRRRAPWSVALAVAAAVLVGIGLWWYPAAKSPADRRAELLARAARAGADVVRVDWTATDDPAGRGVTGDVVWDPVAQEGYMRFRGLQANVPAESQYQLWVFDEARDARYPVDGGVFDIPAGPGEVIVPIGTKLGVTRATLFAVTVERPGGVVVSSRERLPLLAKVADRKPG